MFLRVIVGVYLVISILFQFHCSFAAEALSGKDVFEKVKGPYGACNTCHPGGSSAGRWDSEFNEISADGDKKIPELKGIGKKKSTEQLEKIIILMRSKYKVPIKDEQIKALVKYVSSL